MEWKNWSSLPLKERHQLPAESGIYIIVDAEDHVWYVGKSKNINARWQGKGHHRYQQLSRTNNKRLYNIYWKLFPREEINEKEQLYIDLFKPSLNYSLVKKYAKKARQPNAEISRLLKVINKKTTLFPDIRSIVLGYYIEADEDEDGEFKDYTCIIIAVNGNDHDGPILKSYYKSYSRKGISLKGHWYIYESMCGKDDSTIDPALIPVFVLGNIVYEFVCCSILIENLGQNKTNLCNVEIAKQNVLALKNPDILPSTISSLIANDKYFLNARRSEYLHYRDSDIRPIMELISSYDI